MLQKYLKLRFSNTNRLVHSIYIYVQLLLYFHLIILHFDYFDYFHHAQQDTSPPNTRLLERHTNSIITRRVLGFAGCVQRKKYWQEDTPSFYFSLIFHACQYYGLVSWHNMYSRTRIILESIASITYDILSLTWIGMHIYYIMLTK